MAFDLKTEQALPWLAALIDGEGSIYISKHMGPRGYPRYRPVVVIAANTDYRLMEAIRSVMREGQIYEHRVSNTRGSYNPRKKQQWTYRLNIEQIDRWLPKIRPYLVLKGEQADLLAEVMGLKASRDPRKPGSIRDVEGKQEIERRVEEIYAQTRELNTRGREVGDAK